MADLPGRDDRAEIQWRRLDEPATEHAALSFDGEMHVLAGLVDGTTKDGRAYRIRYTVRCAADWVTHDALLDGNVGGSRIDTVIGRDAATGAWTLNGLPHIRSTIVWTSISVSPRLRTPCRFGGLALPSVESASVRAAWLRFPDLELEVLEQRYERVGESAYIYESDEGRFRAELRVDATGIVIQYDRYWIGSVTTTD